MALTRDFRETVAARSKRDPAFKAALLQEALLAKESARQCRAEAAWALSPQGRAEIAF